MTNWKGKLCSPAARIPVKEEGFSEWKRTMQMTQLKLL